MNIYLWKHEYFKSKYKVCKSVAENIVCTQRGTDIQINSTRYFSPEEKKCKAVMIQ